MKSLGIKRSAGYCLPRGQGLLPLDYARFPSEISAGLTLAALAAPELMAYTRISDTPVITGLACAGRVSTHRQSTIRSTRRHRR